MSQLKSNWTFGKKHTNIYCLFHFCTVNLFLAGIAIADTLIMLEYIPFTIHMNRLDDDQINYAEKVRFIYNYFEFIYISNLLGCPVKKSPERRGLP